MRFQQPSKAPTGTISLDDFAGGKLSSSESQSSAKPWEQHDPDAARRTGLNVRLNDWELEVVRFLAKREGRSQLDIVRRALRPVLEQAVAEATKD